MTENGRIVAKAIDDADPGYSIRLTSLVDDVSEYTLTAGDEVHKFEWMEDAQAMGHQLRLEAQARAAIAASDHALIGWAMCVQDATWEEWGNGKGEFCFAGVRHATSLDEFGCPILTPNLRAVLSRATGAA